MGFNLQSAYTIRKMKKRLKMKNEKKERKKERKMTRVAEEKNHLHVSLLRIRCAERERESRRGGQAKRFSSRPTYALWAKIEAYSG